MNSYTSHLIKSTGAAIIAFFILLPPAAPFQVKQGKVALTVSFRLAKGYEFTEGAPSRLICTTDKSEVVRFIKARKPFDPDEPYKVSMRVDPGEAIITLKAVLHYCDKNSKMCLSNTYQTSVTIETGPAAGSTNILYVWPISPAQTKAHRP